MRLFCFSGNGWLKPSEPKGNPTSKFQFIGVNPFGEVSQQTNKDTEKLTDWHAISLEEELQYCKSYQAEANLRFILSCFGKNWIIKMNTSSGSFSSGEGVRSWPLSTERPASYPDNMYYILNLWKILISL